MEEGSLYRRNPARDVEAFAITVLRCWMGDRGTVEDMSSGHGPDFTLAYSDGRRGLPMVFGHGTSKSWLSQGCHRA